METISDEVQQLAAKLLHHKGNQLLSSNASCTATVVAAGISANESSRSSCCAHQHSVHKPADVATHISGPCSITALKSAYMQAASNVASIKMNAASTPTTSAGSSSSSNRSSSDIPAAAPSLAELRSNWLAATKQAEISTAEAAAAAAEAAKATAAAETAAAGISVSALRSSWLEAQKREARAAAEPSAAAAAVASTRSRAVAFAGSGQSLSLSTSKEPSTTTSAPNFEQQQRSFTLADMKPAQTAKPIAKSSLPAACTVRFTVENSLINEKSKEVAQMAEMLLRTRRISFSDAGAAVDSDTLGIDSLLATARSLPVAVATCEPPVAVGDATIVDVDG